MKISEFIGSISGKRIHIVGVTGSEGSGMLKFLVKHGIGNITAHDYIGFDQIDSNYRLWHKGVSIKQREENLEEFRKILDKSSLNFGENYLKDIGSAEIIFVPQSWRLYSDRNEALFKVKNVPFYNITRIYLEFSKSKIIGITGTVGKGSTARLIYDILSGSGRKSEFTGNESWIIQSADRIDEREKDEYLVLEISHRQLFDGISKCPQIMVYTNLYPNHLDEMDFETYKRVKTFPLTIMKNNNIAVVNFDNDDLRKITSKIKSNIIYYSKLNKQKNIKTIRDIFDDILNIKNSQFAENMLAAATVASLEGIENVKILEILKTAKSLPARNEILFEDNRLKIIDDIKSTTPWATMAALGKISGKSVLICGGDTKGIDYHGFMEILNKKDMNVIVLESKMSDLFRNKIKKLEITDTFEKALTRAVKILDGNGTVLISPAGAFFYSGFIRGKVSIRKIISLLPKGRV